MILMTKYEFWKTKSSKVIAKEEYRDKNEQMNVVHEI